MIQKRWSITCVRYTLPPQPGRRRKNPVAPAGRGGGKTHGICHAEEPAGGPEPSEGRICICLKTRNADPSPQKARLRMTALAAFLRSLLPPSDSSAPTPTALSRARCVDMKETRPLTLLNDGMTGKNGAAMSLKSNALPFLVSKNVNICEKHAKMQVSL